MIRVQSEWEAPPRGLLERTDEVGEWSRETSSQQRSTNVGEVERGVSVAAGAILALAGISRQTIPGMLMTAVGGGLIYRGATGRCPVYGALGMDTAAEEGAEWSRAVRSHGIHVDQVFLVNRPPEELYRFWRNFENLPRIMWHLKSVRVMDDRRSHWVAKAPRIASGQVEWDAEITDDRANELISWRSLPDADVDNRGSIRFAPAAGDRGTEVRVSMSYSPPAGRLGDWIATLFGRGAQHEIREGLRNFKQFMETGEVPTIQGQPRGTCTGRGNMKADEARRSRSSYHRSEV